MSISGMRAGLADNLKAIPGLRVAETIPDNPSPPIAIISLDSVDYHGALNNGLNTYTFTVQVVVASMSERNAQARLDLYAEPLGNYSVRQAIELERTLGGNCYDCKVSGVPNVGSLLIAETNYLAAEFSVVAYA